MDQQVRERMEMYKHVLWLERKSLIFRKLYSYFRVTSAVLESVSSWTSQVFLFLS